MGDNNKTNDETIYYKRVKVTNVPLNVRNQAFHDLCGRFGRVQSIEMTRKNNNQIGFASYITTEDAQYAVYRLQNLEFQGNILKAYPAPITKEQRDAKLEEEKRKRDEREASFRNKPKKVKQPSKGSLRFLTPINPHSENGEFVQVGISIPARNNNKRRNRYNQGADTNNETQNAGQNQNKGQGNTQNKGQAKGNQTNNKGTQNKSQGNQNKNKSQQTNNQGTQNEAQGNQNKSQQTNNQGTQNKAQGNQNKAQAKVQNKGQNNGNQGKTKYRKKNQQQQEVVLAPSSDLIEEEPLTYYEVTVRNTTTDQIVLRIQRRQDELDKPIILKNEITF